MVKFKRNADIYYDERGNIVAVISRHVTDLSASMNEHDTGYQFIQNGVGVQELLNELLPIQGDGHRPH